jgi:hypothetical protein
MSGGRWVEFQYTHKKGAHIAPLIIKQNKLLLFAYCVTNINVFNDFFYYYYVIRFYTFAYYRVFIVYA